MRASANLQLQVDSYLQWIFVDDLGHCSVEVEDSKESLAVEVGHVTVDRPAPADTLSDE